VGKATAEALVARGLRADVVPSSFSAADLVAEFPAAAGARCCSPVRPRLRAPCRTSFGEGLAVTVLPVYDTVLDRGDAAAVKARLAAGEVAAVTFTSSSTAENFRELLPTAT